MDRPKIFITQEVMTANYSDIERFGDPVFLSTSEVSNVPDSLHNRKLVAFIRSRFADYNPERDFIAPSGSPIVAGLVFAMAREKGTTFNVLKWNNRDRQYTPIRISVEGTRDVY